MCGICGHVGPTAQEAPIAAMTATLAHRGPDDRGWWTGAEACLGHTRLAVIDLTGAAHQPMQTADGRLTIVFNGEIYNYRELGRQLNAMGETLVSTSDTEVILKGYRRWGPKILEKLEGMFAFALWDAADRQLLLARDRIGIKPLFYMDLAPGLVFGSEIKAMAAHPAVPCRLNPAAVDAFMAFGFVPGPETIFDRIRSLPPGHTLTWTACGPRVWRYWAPVFAAGSVRVAGAELVEQLDCRLNDAVQRHLVADVPVGAFVSGGLDSSLVAAIAQRQSRKTLQTFTIGFEGGGDERPFARRAARHIGASHQSQVVSAELAANLPRLLWHLEQPLFDNSILPTYLLSQFARRKVKVVLSGDGGDEPFGGYDWTRYALSLPPAALAPPAAGWQWAYRRGPAGSAKRLLHDLTAGGEARYLRRMQVPGVLCNALYSPAFLREIQRSIDRDRLKTILASAPVRDPRDRYLFADLCFYLPEDVLVKVDRMSMACGLEVRVPLLDHRLLEWILTLPFDMRFRHFKGKYLLRKVAARYLPPEILRFRKQGFTVPVGRWLHGKLGEVAGRIFASPSFGGRGIFNPSTAGRLLAMHRSRRYELGHRIWALMVFEVWARLWLDRCPLAECLPEAGGQVFPELTP